MSHGTRWILALLFAVGCRAAPPPLAELPDFRTVDKALTTEIKRGVSVTAQQTGYLGILFDGDRLVVADVVPDSPAGKAGLLRGDVIVHLMGEEVDDIGDFRDRVQALAPGGEAKLLVEREGRRQEIAATVGATSRPMQSGERRGILGLQIGEPKEEGGAPVTRVSRGQPAEAAGVKVGDVLLEIDGVPIASAAQLSETVGVKKPGDTVILKLQRGEKTEELKIQLAADTAGDGYYRGGSIWKKDKYRLAVVGIQYPDVKHNEKIALKDWEESLFSKGTYADKNGATGQRVFGSLNDYYLEQSCGAFRVEGKMFDWVEVSRKRMDYSPGSGTSNKSALLVEALDKLVARDGKDALAEFDGIFFLYAGDRVATNRGGLYWPHRASVTYKSKRWPYFIVGEGGARMCSISVFAHEFGHMLGLPDLYARPENPGSEGLGAWCAMSNQNGNGRPQHFGAWCKEQLGWLKPAIIDPTVRQRLLLAPVEGSSKECLKVLLRPDGSEYLLLENRRKTGFDCDLPAEGLLIWRVVRSRPILEESHGVEGAQGPRVFVASVPYPSAANDAFTPFTVPSSRSQIGGGHPVYITNIRRLSDGKVSFSIGYAYQ